MTKAILAIGAFFVASFIAIAALFIPPQGIIDSSALWCVAQFLVMCCTILGIDVTLQRFITKYSHAHFK